MAKAKLKDIDFDKDELIIVDCVQGSPEWHALRAWPRRQASFTPMVMNTSRWQDEADAYDYLVDGKKYEGNIITDYGQRKEPRARARLELVLQREGAPVFGYRNLYGASLDFRDDDGTDVWDIKCPFQKLRSKTWEHALAGVIEPAYCDQLEHQFRVFRPETIGLFVYIDDNNYKLLPYTPNDQRWGEIQRQWDQFAELVVNKTRPTKVVARTDKEFVELSQKYALAKKSYDQSKEIVEEMAKQLKTLAGTDTKRVGSQYLTITTFPKQGSIDWEAAAKELDPLIDGELYRKEGSTEQRITITKG
jgi:hypothetical protein